MIKHNQKDSLDNNTIIEKLIKKTSLIKNTTNNDGLNILFYCISINNTILFQMLMNIYDGFNITEKCNNLNILLFTLNHPGVDTKTIYILLYPGYI